MTTKRRPNPASMLAANLQRRQRELENRLNLLAMRQGPECQQAAKVRQELKIVRAVMDEVF